MQYPAPAVAALVFAAAGLASCMEHGHHPRVAFASSASAFEDDTEPHAPPVLTSDGRVILVTLDGVRAEDVFEGADPGLRPGARVRQLMRPEAVMPRTSRLVATRGVALGADRPGCGSVRTASGANVSLPGYFEIFSGRKTLCRDNHCEGTKIRTVLDEAAAAGLRVASIGSWDMLDRAVSRGSSGVFVGAGSKRWDGQRPLDDSGLEALVVDGERAAPFPGVGAYRPDAQTTSIALAYARTFAPAVFHVGLGDADEWGHRDDYRAYLDAIGAADAFIGSLADWLESAGDIGARTTVLVTTDHGRNRDFRHHGAESASAGRSFVLAFGPRVPVRGVACPSRDITLADIAPTIRALVGLPADPSAEAGRAIAEIAENAENAEIAGSPASRRAASRHRATALISPEPAMHRP